MDSFRRRTPLPYVSQKATPAKLDDSGPKPAETQWSRKVENERVRNRWVLQNDSECPGGLGTEDEPSGLSGLQLDCFGLRRGFKAGQESSLGSVHQEQIAEGQLETEMRPRERDETTTFRLGSVMVLDQLRRDRFRPTPANLIQHYGLRRR